MQEGNVIINFSTTAVGAHNKKCARSGAKKKTQKKRRVEEEALKGKLKVEMAR